MGHWLTHFRLTALKHVTVHRVSSTEQSPRADTRTLDVWERLNVGMLHAVQVGQNDLIPAVMPYAGSPLKCEHTSAKLEQAASLNVRSILACCLSLIACILVGRCHLCRKKATQLCNSTKLRHRYH